jgi:arylsulfatase A-like enzyme
MDGSHYPYTDHSPAAFKRFLPEPSPNSIEAYDNSIAYTDHFLANLYEAFSSKPSAGWMFFTPDHGQSLGAGKNRYNDNYDTDVIEIPAIAFSVGVNNYDTVLASNMPAPISSVDVFATILDLLELEPAMKIDGYSLFKKIPDDRIRICSEYMPTFHNNPNAAFILPDKSTFRIDFTRGTFSRLGEMEKTSTPINKLPENVTLLLNSRMKTADEN